MTYQPVPIESKGVKGVRKVVQVEDDDVLVVMKQILIEMKMINYQLEIITNEEITPREFGSP